MPISSRIIFIFIIAFLGVSITAADQCVRRKSLFVASNFTNINPVVLLSAVCLHVGYFNRKVKVWVVYGVYDLRV
jgi:hypothetical protein